MKQGLFTVRDDVAEAFCLPFCALNVSVASRSFLLGCKDPESQIGKAPSDYVLYQIGVFDDDTGVIEPCLPTIVVRGHKE